MGHADNSLPELETPQHYEARISCPFCLRDYDDTLTQELWAAMALSNKPKTLVSGAEEKKAGPLIRSSERAEYIKRLIDGEKGNDGEPITLLQVTQHFSAHEPPQPAIDKYWIKRMLYPVMEFIDGVERRGEIVRFISQLGWVSIAQVGEVFFPSYASGESRSKGAERELRQLRYRQVVYGAEVLRRTRSQERMIYGLTKLGAKIISDELQAQNGPGPYTNYRPRSLEHPDDVPQTTIKHHLETTNLMIACQRSARQQPVQRLGQRDVMVKVNQQNWWAENYLGMRYRHPSYINHYKHPVHAGAGNIIPDGLMAVGIVTQPDQFDGTPWRKANPSAKRGQLLPVFLENDRSTELTRVIQDKLIRYLWLAESLSVFKRFPELHRETDKRLAEVRYQVPMVFVTTGDLRAKRLRDAVRDLAQARRVRLQAPIFTSTAPAMLEHGLSAPVVSVWDETDTEVTLLRALVSSASYEGRSRPGTPALGADHILVLDRLGAQAGRSDEERQMSKAEQAAREQEAQETEAIYADLAAKQEALQNG